ncbi:hypothetical protein [Streptomyces sp. NPDC055912]|uniref:hypothetical protein n=1 Tax=Streptomyces sp. NPDC055912 TaxID=3345660 RepID=UPI0035E0BFF1
MDLLNLFVVSGGVSVGVALVKALNVWLALRARARLARAVASLPEGVSVEDWSKGAEWRMTRSHRPNGDTGE